jgi:hypothetical protein
MNLVTRQQWGARPPKSVKTIASSEGIFVHYTVTPTGPDEAAIVRNVQAFHMDTRGWQDIAYSFLVGQSGNVYEGRGWGVAGGHTEGWNSRSHAVCWIGNQETPSDAALAAIDDVCAEHARRYGGWVKAHRDVNSTSCPGDKLAAWVAAGRPTTQEPDVPITAEEIDQIAGRVRDFLANPAINPGTVIDPGARSALTYISAAVAVPPAGQTVDVQALADALSATLGADIAAELARRLAS